MLSTFRVSERESERNCSTCSNPEFNQHILIVSIDISTCLADLPISLSLRVKGKNAFLDLVRSRIIFYNEATLVTRFKPSTSCYGKEVIRS